ncbi:MAG: class I SAM-dependent methyltransferase [Rhodothermales bacterium]
MKKDPYHRIARWYDALFEPINAGLIAVGMKMLPPVKNLAILDVGCGTGSQLAAYQKAGGAVFGIDSSEAMLNVAREKLGDGARLHLGDATAMPFDDEAFDVVTATLVLHEMAAATRDAVIAETKRVLRPRGYLLFTDFHPGPLRPLKGWFMKVFITLSEMGAGREHFRNYRTFMARKGLPGLIAKHGLVIEKERVVSGGNMAVFLLRKNARDDL